jgi:hypothetical protein
MRSEANHFVRKLAEANEKQLWTRYDMDAAAIVQDDDDESRKRTGSGFMRNIIIDPTTSSWLWVWNFFVTLLLFRGYVHDPYHIAFILSSKNSTNLDALNLVVSM